MKHKLTGGYIYSKLRMLNSSTPDESIESKTRSRKQRRSKSK